MALILNEAHPWIKGLAEILIVIFRKTSCLFLSQSDQILVTKSSKKAKMIFTFKQKNSKSKSMNLHIGDLIQWICCVLLLLEILLDLVELLCKLFLLLFLLFLQGTEFLLPLFSLFFGLVSVSLFRDDLNP